MAVIYNKKTKSWGYYGTIKKDGKTIHSYRKRSGYSTKKKAMLAEEKYREGLDINLLLRPSLSELVESFLPFWKTQVKPSTAEQEEKVSKKLIRELGDNHTESAQAESYDTTKDKKLLSDYNDASEAHG